MDRKEAHRQRMAERRRSQLRRKSDYPIWRGGELIPLFPPSKSDSAAYRKPFVRDRKAGAK